MTNIGRLEPVDVRELWQHEERGFSTWLELNLDVLSDAVKFRLTDPVREKSAGCFECDLVCENEDGEPVIVENQLEKTNHDHLGKVLTYLANLEAKAAIWISTDPRAEHIRTIQWLNETTPPDVCFYLVRLAAFRIAGCEPAAPLFTLIVGPSDESKSIGQEKKDLAERHILRMRFWETLLERARARGLTLHSQRAPAKQLYLGAGIGFRAGVSLNYLVWKSGKSGKTAVELYINNHDSGENKRIFDSLAAHKPEIEAAFGQPLLWERMENNKASRIRFTLSKGGLQDETRWPEIQDATVEAMDKLYKALKPFLQNLG